MKDDDLTSGVLDVTKSKEEQQKIGVTSVYVNDQEKALRFSTEVLAS